MDNVQGSESGDVDQEGDSDVDGGDMAAETQRILRGMCAAGRGQRLHGSRDAAHMERRGPAQCLLALLQRRRHAASLHGGLT